MTAKSKGIAQCILHLHRNRFFAIIEFITCVKEIEEDYIHATVGYKVPDEELDLDYCKEPVSMEVQYALSNSLGFGGQMQVFY